MSEKAFFNKTMLANLFTAVAKQIDDSDTQIEEDYTGTDIVRCSPVTVKTIKVCLNDDQSHEDTEIKYSITQKSYPILCMDRENYTGITISIDVDYE